jgi:hypothetical protein
MGLREGVTVTGVGEAGRGEGETEAVGVDEKLAGVAEGLGDGSTNDALRRSGSLSSLTLLAVLTL